MAGRPESHLTMPNNTSGYISLLGRLDDAIASCIDLNTHLGLLLIDLSHIEILYPILGFRKVSEILDTLHSTLAAIKRPSDFISRINEYRFALVITDLAFPAIVDLAVNKLHVTLDGLHSLTGCETTIHAKTGIALFPQHGNTAEKLLIEADTAVLAAYNTSTMVMRAGSLPCKQISQYKLLESELESAFLHSQFQLYYQPKINLASNTLCGAEALIRWNHPDLGAVSPDMLIRVIERSPLLQEITFWTLNNALNQSRWMRKHFPEFRIAVNLSPELLDSPDLVELVSCALRIWDTNPDLLILEVTETAMMVNQEASIENLRKLNEAGIMLSIDDFGTGYSSYSYLQKIPVQELKIDKSFVLNLLTDERNNKLVKSMISLGRELGINVLAEGIENREVLVHLQNMGCQYGQGYHIAKPMSASEILGWMDTSDLRKSIAAPPCQHRSRSGLTTTADPEDS
jgi:EAL domain-containing protein (putative c-di-GMP-specific phosphodiesterase class I)/GGDEF domain-containing protein